MPIYEYRCRKCGKNFEFLKKSAGDKPGCPHCNSREAERLLSRFAVGKGGQATKADACENCTGDPAACPRMNGMAGHP
jgi:putative FmdB family regulatory protein